MPKRPQNTTTRKVTILAIETKDATRSGEPYWRVLVNDGGTENWHSCFERHSIPQIEDSVDKEVSVIFKRNTNPNFGDLLMGIGDLEDVHMETASDAWDTIIEKPVALEPPLRPAPQSNRNASIERQVSLYAATQLAVAFVGAGKEMASEDVLVVASAYYDWIQEIHG